MLKLETLKELTKKRKRVGRGGDRGGTSGKGHKGQNARSGGKVSRIAFEGGQMPLVRRLPKRGFNNTRFARIVEIVNLRQLDTFFAAGSVVTKEELLQKGVIKSNKRFMLKVLGAGQLTKKLIIHADAFSESAADAIKKVGGEVHIIQES